MPRCTCCSRHVIRSCTLRVAQQVLAQPITSLSLCELNDILIAGTYTLPNSMILNYTRHGQGYSKTSRILQRPYHSTPWHLLTEEPARHVRELQRC